MCYIFRETHATTYGTVVLCYPSLSGCWLSSPHLFFDRLLFIADGLHATGSLYRAYHSLKSGIPLNPLNPPVEREWIKVPTESILIYATSNFVVGGDQPIRKTLWIYFLRNKTNSRWGNKTARANDNRIKKRYIERDYRFHRSNKVNILRAWLFTCRRKTELYQAHSAVRDRDAANLPCITLILWKYGDLSPLSRSANRCCMAESYICT